MKNQFQVKLPDNVNAKLQEFKATMAKASAIAIEHKKVMAKNSFTPISNTENEFVKDSKNTFANIKEHLGHVVGIVTITTGK